MRTTIVFAFLAIICQGCSEVKPGITYPVIYTTDLYQPPMDPDDNFNLACLFSIKEFDIRAIVIDNAARIPVTPGIIPILQIEHISSKTVPYAVGLKENLKSLDDDGATQKDFRQGVELILGTLEKSTSPVTVITVGSLRDVAAAINTNAELCRTKIERIFVFAGDAAIRNPREFREYNVDLDTMAFARVMNSGLNIYWVPCFDGGGFINNGRASYFKARRENLFASVSPRLMNYFRYCLLSSKDSSYIDALTLPPDSEDIKTITYKQEEGARNLWCSHIFPFIAKRNYILENNDCFTRRNDEILKDCQIIIPFTFRQEDVFTDMHGMVWPDTTAGKASKINVFEIADKEAFASQMTSVVSHLLRELDR
ncbi:MAG: nucleoside hydrolase [Bacteroidales bacterium]|nr:nucleoside hydrolase [Bacteroidales bacterium]